MHGFSHCSLRLFNVYGPRQAVDHPYANVTCKFSHAAALGLAVRRYGDGQQSRDFVFVDDVVEAFTKVLESSREHIYNVGTAEQHSINELLGLLENISGRSIAVEQHAAWPNDIRQICADISRIRKEFGFTPNVPIQKGLAATVAFFRNIANTQGLDGE
jgi:UDP-glucose 4-epimerase